MRAVLQPHLARVGSSLRYDGVLDVIPLGDVVAGGAELHAFEERAAELGEDLVGSAVDGLVLSGLPAEVEPLRRQDRNSLLRGDDVFLRGRAGCQGDEVCYLGNGDDNFFFCRR